MQIICFFAKVVVHSCHTPSSGTFFPRTPPSSCPSPTTRRCALGRTSPMRDSYCYSALQLTWVALARKMPASCSPTRSFLGPPVAALGPHLAPLLAPSLPARRSGLATLKGQGAALLGPTSPRRCPCEEGPSRFLGLTPSPTLFHPLIKGGPSHLANEKRE